MFQVSPFWAIKILRIQWKSKHFQASNTGKSKRILVFSSIQHKFSFQILLVSFSRILSNRIIFQFNLPKISKFKLCFPFQFSCFCSLFQKRKVSINSLCRIQPKVHPGIMKELINWKLLLLALRRKSFLSLTEFGAKKFFLDLWILIVRSSPEERELSSESSCSKMKNEYFSLHFPSTLSPFILLELLDLIITKKTRLPENPCVCVCIYHDYY